MSSKSEILEKIRLHAHPQVEMPDFESSIEPSADKIEAFKQAVKAVGGETVLLDEYGTIENLIVKRFPEAKRIATNLEGVPCATENPDEFAEASMLNGVDVGVVEGHFGVIENGAIWLTQTLKHKALYFISEALVILLDKSELLETMHEAYRRKELYTDFEYGCYISGPSKTADIEQALVIGAHGARAVTVVLR